MKTGFVPTIALGQAARTAIRDVQHHLETAERELSTGRHADAGLVLGHRTARAVSLRHAVDRLTTISETNATTQTRLEVAQTALEGLGESTHKVLAAVIAARDTEGAREAAVTAAQNALSMMETYLSASVNGTFVFAGVNTDIKPLSNYVSEPVSPAKTAVDADFLSAFGVAQSSANVSGIAPDDMQAFLDGTFASRFDPVNWTVEWSAASSSNVRSRIATSTLVETSVNANDDAIRSLAMAFTAIADLGGTQLQPETFQVVADAAITAMGSGLDGIASLQTRLGGVEAQITEANRRLELQRTTIMGGLQDLEQVDPFEASVRATQLITQLETTYALTARLQSLSLTNYLSR